MRVKTLTSSSPLGAVRQDKGDGWQPDGGVGRHALPHRRVEDLGAHGLGDRLEKSAGSFVVVASLLETWEQARQEPIQACKQNNNFAPNIPIFKQNNNFSPNFLISKQYLVSTGTPEGQNGFHRRSAMLISPKNILKEVISMDVYLLQ